MRARRRGYRSRGEAGCVSDFAKGSADQCDERNNGDTTHSRLVGQEIDLICNHNFV